MSDKNLKIIQTTVPTVSKLIDNTGDEHNFIEVLLEQQETLEEINDKIVAPIPPLEVIGIEDADGNQINPATEETLDSIDGKLNALATAGKQDDMIEAIEGIEFAEWIKALGIDKDDATYYYFGYVKVGTTNWRIKRMAKADFSIYWASGDGDLATAWSGRASHTYSLGI